MVSFLGHMTVFSLFGFSFGDKIPPANYTPTTFWGMVLRNSDLVPRRQHPDLKMAPLPHTAPLLPQTNKVYPPISNVYLKPAVGLVFNSEKMVFVSQTQLGPGPWRKKEPVMMFYPHLPYNFLLYFQDRQAVHIELMFNISLKDNVSLINIKRKISSGNLEADLLTLRYIGHYLSIEEAAFPQNKWQTVKIDLSQKND